MTLNRVGTAPMLFRYSGDKPLLDPAPPQDPVKVVERNTARDIMSWRTLNLSTTCPQVVDKQTGVWTGRRALARSEIRVFH